MPMVFIKDKMAWINFFIVFYKFYKKIKGKYPLFYHLFLATQLFYPLLLKELNIISQFFGILGNG